MFLNLTMLAGLGGALIPVLLHLLSRSRYRTVQWGAMMFLEGADARVMQAARLKQLAILLLRMGIVAGLAMALAQPVIRNRWGGLARDTRAAAVIVLDCSASMGVDEDGRTRIELARGAVLNILEGLREGRVAVVVLGTAGKDAEQLAVPTTDLQQVAQRVMALTEPSGRANLSAGLSRAAEILSRTSEPVRELYVVCDRQASTWKEVSDQAFVRGWRARLDSDRGDGRTHFYVIPVGSDKGENLAIESVELVNPPAVIEQPAEIEVKVRNYGRALRGGVELKVDDKSTTISVPPGGASTVRVPVRFHQAGSHLVTAALVGTGLKFDDRMQASVDVAEPIRVLVVSGDERGLPLQDEADFLRVALAPRTAQVRQAAKARGTEAPDRTFGDPCKVEVVPAERWNADELRKHNVVVLANVPELTAGQALALEQFVYEGGGLWIAPGNLVRADNYNELLYRGGTGIMPAKLGQPVAEDGSEATALQGITNLEHPVFRFLKGRPDPIPLVTIGRYFPVDVRPREATVLAQYASGRPFLVESVSGRIHVLLMTTPLDADWGTLPLSNFYLPLAQSAVRYLTSGQAAQRNLAPGDAILARFTGAAAEVRQVALRVRPATPGAEGSDGRVAMLPVTRGEVRYTATQQPGVYELRPVEPKDSRLRLGPLYFVVRTPTAESDLTPLTGEKWEGLSRGLQFELIDPARRSITAAVAEARGGRELWLTLVGAVIALGLVELAVVRRWSAEGGGV